MSAGLATQWWQAGLVDPPRLGDQGCRGHLFALRYA